jgi:hypothetical protein
VSGGGDASQQEAPRPERRPPNERGSQRLTFGAINCSVAQSYVVVVASLAPPFAHGPLPPPLPPTVGSARQRARPFAAGWRAQMRSMTVETSASRLGAARRLQAKQD